MKDTKILETILLPQHSEIMWHGHLVKNDNDTVRYLCLVELPKPTIDELINDLESIS